MAGLLEGIKTNIDIQAIIDSPQFQTLFSKIAELLFSNNQLPNEIESSIYLLIQNIVCKFSEGLYSQEIRESVYGKVLPVLNQAIISLKEREKSLAMASSGQLYDSYISIYRTIIKTVCRYIECTHYLEYEARDLNSPIYLEFVRLGL